MAGHSKWKTIKHKKAAADAKRGKLFTKLIKEITVAARAGGGDAAANPRLRFLLERARDINMPLENAQRAIKKGTGELPGQQYEQNTYEGYGPGGVAVIVEVLTDNKNKAIAELRHIFSRHGGSVAENGAVSWMFQRAGLLSAEGAVTEESLLDILLAYDIYSLDRDDEESAVWHIACAPKDMEGVKDALVGDLKMRIEEATLGWRPTTVTAVNPGMLEKVEEFLAAVDDLEDVQEVYDNLSY